MNFRLRVAAATAAVSLGLAAAALAMPGMAHAATLIQGLGLFSAGAPTSAYTAPNRSFSFSFELPDDFANISLDPAQTSLAANFHFRLNGVEIAVGAPQIRFTGDGFAFGLGLDSALLFTGPDIGADGVISPPFSGMYDVVLGQATGPFDPVLYTAVGSAMVVATRATGSYGPPAGGPPPNGPGNPSEPDPEVGAAVPEPATWALLIAGFGLAGAALRRGRPALAGA